MNTEETRQQEMQAATRKAGRSLAWKMLLPVVIGVGVVVWLFMSEFDPGVWKLLPLDGRTVGFVALAALFIMGRDMALSWRFRGTDRRELSWFKAIKVNLLCEFTSCVTPTAVGGSTFGLIYLNREGISLGRSTTVILTTLFLDELFFVLACPVAFMLIPYKELFGFSGSAFTIGLETAFWIVYGVVTVWTATLFVGIFVKPGAVRALLDHIFSWRLLRRWKERVHAVGLDMETAGRDLRHRPWHLWLKAFGATILSWSSRFLVVNALFLAFAPAASQLTVFLRQLVVWVVLMASPTPGGSGVSEWLFATYYGDLISNASMALVIALFWRAISYYAYLLVGAFMMPPWLRTNYRAIKQSLSRNKEAKSLIE